MLASVWLFSTPAKADSFAVPFHLDAQMAHDGWTLKQDNGAELGIFPGVLTDAADVFWTTSTDLTPTLPENHTQLGPLYRLTIATATLLDTSRYRIAVALSDTPSSWVRQIWIYDLATASWSPLDSKYNTKTKKWQTGFTLLDAYVTIVEDRTMQEGKATWYGTYKYMTKLQYVAASNTIPKGKYVKVTNKVNNKSIEVKVVDAGSFQAPIIIDLSTPAFKKIWPLSEGKVDVRVEILKGPTSGSPPLPPVTTEEIPKLSVSATGTGSPPKVAGKAYMVIDAGTGKVLQEKNSASALPIASLTKLMTAMVVLDTKPDLKKIVTYTRADITACCAYLQVKPNEKLTVKDLLYSMLVGSANNAATALARSTGMTNAKFIAAMNAKAKAWGLQQTIFVDVSGLDPRNVSSAADLAIIANHAFHDYPVLRAATVTPVYRFTTTNTKKTHTIKTTDKLLSAVTKLNITGGKTGFLDEAQYTYLLRTKNSQGAHVIVVLLGSPTAKQRFNDAAALAAWAWKAYRWQ